MMKTDFDQRLSGVSDPQEFSAEAQRRDFMSFLIRAFAHLNGDAELMCNWHLEAIAHELDRVARGKNHRLLVTLPPRSLKSIMISVAWVAWQLGRDPRRNFVCVSYSNELSAKHARDCRAIMQSAWYRKLFPRTIIAASRSAAHDFETTAGGGRLATSVGGTLTGRGGDTIIIDDPIKPEDAFSDTVRKQVNDWYGSTLASRLNDKAHGSIILVMQRLHQDDLAGMLLEQGDWHELTLPAIALEDSMIPLSRRRMHHRLEGDVLHPERESYAELMKLKRTLGSLMWDAQYQQRPVPPEGNIVRARWLGTYDGINQDGYGQIVQSWDTANKEGVFNDWSVGITACVQDNKLFVLDVFRRRLEFPDLRKAVIAQAREYRADVLLIEDQASGQQLLQSLRYDLPPGVPYPIGRRPETDKLSRMVGTSAMIEAGQLLLPRDAPWLAEFRRELLEFPQSRYKDQVDALSQLLDWARSRNFDLPVLAGPEPVFEDDGFDYIGCEPGGISLEDAWLYLPT